jgi:hypothetical protein
VFPAPIKKRPTGERRTKDRRRPEGLAGVKSLSLALLYNRVDPVGLFRYFAAFMIFAVQPDILFQRQNLFSERGIPF